MVIGAGISGLTVAASLECDFLVLEARDRIGGRVWSREHGSYTLDMGAAWIHGSNNNPLNQYLNYDEMIPVSESNPWIHTGNARILYQGVSDEDRQQMVMSWNHAAKEIAEMDCETIAEAIKHLKNKDSVVCNIQTFLYLLEVWCGTCVSSMPPSFLRNIECDDSLFGDYAGSHCLFKKGTKSLLTSIVEHSKQDLDDRILFEQVVTDILYDRDDGLVQIMTATGETYLCEKLVITTPPGPLQNINFVPPLSASRKCALSKVKMGSYKKVQVEFDRVFWDTDAAMILTNKGYSECKNEGCKNDVYKTEGFRCETSSFIQGCNPAGDKTVGFGCETSSFIPHILWNNYACLKGAPILEAVCPANVGWQLTGKSDEEIADAVLEHLRGMYPWMPDPIS
jgi:monoamine oxidase